LRTIDWAVRCFCHSFERTAISSLTGSARFRALRRFGARLNP
jgi:hypothetical protein